MCVNTFWKLNFLKNSVNICEAYMQHSVDAWLLNWDNFVINYSTFLLCPIKPKTVGYKFLLFNRLISTAINYHVCFQEGKKDTREGQLWSYCISSYQLCLRHYRILHVKLASFPVLIVSNFNSKSEQYSFCFTMCKKYLMNVTFQTISFESEDFFFRISLLGLCKDKLVPFNFNPKIFCPPIILSLTRKTSWGFW